MATMRYEPPPMRKRRSSLLPLACGCLATFAILFAIVIVGGVLLLPQIISRMTGLTAEGQTAQVFAQVTPQPTPVLLNPTTPPQITVDLGQYGMQTITNNNPQLYTFTVGTSSSGQQAAEVTFTEAGLTQLCQQRSTICGPNSTEPRFKNARIDLQPGGAIVYGDATVPQLGSIPLPVGIVLVWDEPTKRIVVQGVDINNTLYAPTTQSLGDLVNTVETQMNNLLQQAAVQVGDGHYTVSDAIVTDTTLTLLLH